MDGQAITVELVETDEQIDTVVKVAHDIWNEYWPALIGQGQTDYMVQTMQSLGPIVDDIRQKGYRYYLIYDAQGTLVGYSSVLVEDFSDDPDNPLSSAHGQAINQIALRRLFISKVYLYAEQRGKHYASRVIEFYEQLCRDEQLDAMYLTVNINNELGIRAYRGRGFQTIQDLAAPIGQGYVMDDHIMCKRVARQAADQR